MDVHLHRLEDIEDIDTDSDRRYNLVRTYVFLDIYPWTYMTALTTTLPTYLIRLDKPYCVRCVLTVTGTSVFIAPSIDTFLDIYLDVHRLYLYLYSDCIAHILQYLITAYVSVLYYQQCIHLTLTNIS